MYHIAIFFCPDDLLDQTVDCLARNDTSRIGVQGAGGSTKAYHRGCVAQEAGEDGYVFCEDWAIMHPPASLPIPLVDWRSGISRRSDLDRLDHGLRICTEALSWCLISWANPGFCPVAAALSQDRELLDRLCVFLDRDHECKSSSGYGGRIIRLLISRHWVDESFNAKCRLVTFGEFGEWGHRIWDRHDCDQSPPLVLFHEERLLWNWTEIRYERIEEFAARGSSRIDRGIYRPASKADFLAMTDTASANGDGFWAVPGETTVASIRKLNDAILDPDHGVDVHYADSILELVPWAYSPLRLPSGMSVCYSRKGGLASDLLAMSPLATTRSFEVLGVF